MTPSQQAKASGYKSLTEVEKIIGESRQTLNNWAKNKPRLLAAVLAGAKLIKAE